MNKKLEEYLPIIKFLVKFLGKDTEVVMHDFTDGLDNSLVFIANNHSGRELGAPATNFVLEVFKSKIYLEKDFLVNYSFKSVNGKELHSSTFFIKEENNLIGMICLNVDRSKRNMLEKLSMNILEILNEEDEAGDELDNIKENFYVNSEHLIEETILQETNGKDIEKYSLSKAEKIAIVASLYQKGFFNMKNSVEKVAEAFAMSEVSIYKYIQQVKNE